MGAALLRALLGSSHECVGLLTGHRRWLGLGDGLQRRARSLRIPILELGEHWSMSALKPDLLVCGDFGTILGPEWLDIPRIGGINAHWSLLPRHRGPAPAVAAILAGDRESGLTFHVLTKRIDAGNIVDQTSFPLGDRDTTARVYTLATQIAEARLPAVLDQIEANGLRGQVQDLASGSYRRRLTDAEAAVDWTHSTESLDRLVRACTRPMAHFEYRSQRVFLSASEPAPGQGTPGEVLGEAPLVIATGDGALRIVRALTLMPPFTWPGWPGLRAGTKL